jgi:mannose-6-phosphate isomerase-like protein (cupin superfamily)
MQGKTVPEGSGRQGRLGTPEGLTQAGHRATEAVAEPRRIDKPWGYELIWAETDDYVGKLLFVRAGESLSLQFHEEKDETLFLSSGELRLELGSGVHNMEPVDLRVGQRVRIVPGVLHRMEAVTDCTVFEVSTAHLDDVVRVRDRYGRAEVTPEARKTE